MLISVVIPVSSVDYISRLRACVNSVNAQDYPKEKIELLIAYLQNGRIGNIDSLRLFCESSGASLIEYVHDKEAWPPSLSRNVGYRRAKGDILVSLDADGVLDKRTFRIAAAHMEARRCAVRVRTSLVPLPPESPLFFRLGSARFKKSVEMGRKAPGPGCCILAPREAVWAIHGWDEQYVGYGPADWDFVERLEKAGWPVVNLSETDDIWTLHQDHKRKLGTPRQYGNIAYHKESVQLSDPVRNKDGWGGEGL